MSSANYTHDEVRSFIQHANTSIRMAKRLNTGLFSVNTAFFVYLNLQGMSISPSPKHFHTSTGIPSLLSHPYKSHKPACSSPSLLPTSALSRFSRTRQNTFPMMERSTIAEIQHLRQLHDSTTSPVAWGIFFRPYRVGKVRAALLRSSHTHAGAVLLSHRQVCPLYCSSRRVLIWSPLLLRCCPL